MRFVLVRLARSQEVIDLLGTLVTEIGAAKHQQGRDRPRQEVAQSKGGGQEEQELVPDRPPGDLEDDGQFAVGRKTLNIAGRHRRIVDDGASGLGACLHGHPRHVIE